VPPLLNWMLAWIATAIGMAEILSWLPRSWLVTTSVIVVALLTWGALHRFGISRRRIHDQAAHNRAKLGY